MTGIMVVTGASRGIGAAVARLAGTKGYKVCVNYHQAADLANQVVADIRAAGNEACAVQADVSVEEDVVRLFRETDEQLGPVTHLVNNTGILGGESRVDDITVELLETVWRTNVTSYFLCAREALRRMSTKNGGKGGAIINISSLAGRTGGRGNRCHYGASKGAVNTFTSGLAMEVAKEGVRVNAVLPGLTATDFHADYGGEERLERLAPTIPIGRVATAEDVANVTLWLCSDEASYVTGDLIDVTGGFRG
jgi:NAD(P)-dependent dehydrogenase (short-subunit alcohol dehydrogenase family)